MTTIICKKLDLVHVTNVDWLHEDTIVLLPNEKFIRVLLSEQAVYQANRTNTDAGSILNETVNAKVRLNDELKVLLRVSLKNYVLRLHTNEGLFIVGSKEYPAELSYSTDKFFVNLSFKASSPLL